QPPTVGAQLDPSTDGLSVRIDAPRAASGLGLRATYLGADGQIATTEPATIAAGAHTYPLDIRGATRLLSLTFERPSPGGAEEIAIPLSVTTAEGAPIPLGGWAGLSTSGATGELTQDGDGGVFDGRFAIGSPMVGIEPKPPA